MAEEKKPWFVSSADGESLSLTVKGLLAGLIPLVILAAKAAGVDLGSDELNAIVTQIGDLVVAVSGVISILATLYGAGRKLYYKLFPKQQNV